MARRKVFIFSRTTRLFCCFYLLWGRTQRCKVWSNTDRHQHKLIKRSIDFFEKIFKKDRCLPEFIKIDVAYNIQEKAWQDVLQEVKQQKHNNHYRQGISFDKQFEINFLEQEIYGKAIIRSVVFNEPNFFDEKI